MITLAPRSPSSPPLLPLSAGFHFRPLAPSQSGQCLAPIPSSPPARPRAPGHLPRRPPAAVTSRSAAGSSARPTPNAHGHRVLIVHLHLSAPSCPPQHNCSLVSATTGLAGQASDPPSSPSPPSPPSPRRRSPIAIACGGPCSCASPAPRAPHGHGAAACGCLGSSHRRRSSASRHAVTARILFRIQIQRRRSEPLPIAQATAPHTPGAPRFRVPASDRPPPRFLPVPPDIRPCSLYTPLQSFLSRPP